MNVAMSIFEYVINYVCPICEKRFAIKSASWKIDTSKKYCSLRCKELSGWE